MHGGIARRTVSWNISVSLTVKSLLSSNDSGYLSGNDQVLIVVDSAKDYVQKAWTALPDAIQKWNK